MGYDYYGYNGLGSTGSSNMLGMVGNGIGSMIWMIIAFLAALVGCFLVYFMFVKKDTELKNKKLVWLRKYLRFDTMLIETILKICYIFAAIFTTLFPFVFLSMGFGGFVMCLLTIIFGNLLTRIIYEAFLIKIMIWKNTTEIKQQLKK